MFNRMKRDIVLFTSTSSLQSNRPSRHLLHQVISIIRLYILPIIIQIAQIMCNVPTVKLPHIKAVAQKCKPIIIPILNLIVFIPGPFEQMQEMQPRPRVYGSLAIDLALLEPRATCARPGSTLQEQIRVLSKLLREVETGCEGFYILLLRFVDDVEHVLRPAFDQGHEAAVAEGAIGTAKGEVVGKGGHAN